MRDGVRLFTIVYAPVDTSRAVPILMTRTPYGSDPYGADAYRGSLGPSPPYEKDGYIFVYQDVRGRFRSEGEFVDMRPHAGRRRDRPTSTRAPTPTTRSPGCSRRPEPQRPGRPVGHLLPGFYTAAGLMRAHPALKAVVAAGADRRLVPGRRLAPQRRLLPGGDFNFFTGFFPRRGGPSAKDASPRSTYGTPDGYDFFLGLGALREGTRAASTRATPSGRTCSRTRPTTSSGRRARSRRT